MAKRYMIRRKAQEKAFALCLAPCALHLLLDSLNHNFIFASLISKFSN